MLSAEIQNKTENDLKDALQTISNMELKNNEDEKDREIQHEKDLTTESKLKKEKDDEIEEKIKNEEREKITLTEEKERIEKERVKQDQINLENSDHENIDLKDRVTHLEKEVKKNIVISADFVLCNPTSFKQSHYLFKFYSLLKLFFNSNFLELQIVSKDSCDDIFICD